MTFSEMSYQVTEGSGYVLITLLVMGQVSVECTVVVDYGARTEEDSCSRPILGLKDTLQSPQPITE